MAAAAAADAGGGSAAAPTAPVAASQPVSGMNHLLQQRPLPSPFESAAMFAPAAAGAGLAGPAGDARLSPKAAAAGGPAKSAMKMNKAEPAQEQKDKNMKQALSWADGHGQAMNQVLEYQPSEQGSGSFSVKKGCQCCIQ